MVGKLLGSENVDANLRSSKGTTPIHFAISRPDHSADELKILRKLHCDPRVDIAVRDKYDRTVLSYSAEIGSTEAIQELLMFEERQDEVERLLNASGDREVLSPLSHAAGCGHTDTIRLLCQTNIIGSQLQSVDKLDGANVFPMFLISRRDDNMPKSSECLVTTIPMACIAAVCQGAHLSL